MLPHVISSGLTMFHNYRPQLHQQIHTIFDIEFDEKNTKAIAIKAIKNEKYL